MINKFNITVAIDGYASTGKSTIAKMLAKEFDLTYIDSGSLYRSVTLFLMNSSFEIIEGFETEELKKNLSSLKIDYNYFPQKNEVDISINGENISKKIRGQSVSDTVSKVSAIREVREYVNTILRSIKSDRNGIVMDGRDIGSVVFPNADLKFFIKADIEKRANWRTKELSEMFDDASFEKIKENIIQRDSIDSGRKESPLIKSKDAIEIDSTDLTLDELFEKIKSEVHKLITD